MVDSGENIQSNREEGEEMAEAAVENPGNARFFCHQCSRQISPNLPDFTCPTCQGGFIEELGEETSADEEDHAAHEDPAAHFANLWEQTFREFPRPRDRRRRERGGRHTVRDQGGRPPMISIRTTRQGGNLPSTTADAATATALDVILHNLFGPLHTTVLCTVVSGYLKLSGGMGQTSYILFMRGEGTGPPLGFPLNLLQLHGSPGDYAWGTGGLDTIITQLLNQMEGAGPPPADKNKIEKLPKVRITQDLVDSLSDCAVCQDRYILDEEVLQLPCEHRFHRDCVLPWLEKHDSCPICRLSLSSEPTRGADGDDSGSSSSSQASSSLL